MTTVTDTYATIKELLEAAFSVGSVQRLYTESHQPSEPHLTLNGQNILFVNIVKYLGVIVG
jgi:hypothetical protein